jgi:hypothetical protein
MNYNLAMLPLQSLSPNKTNSQATKDAKTPNPVLMSCRTPLIRQALAGNWMVSSRTILLGSVIISSAIIISVHYMQVYEKEVMHKGVLRDIERQQAKKSMSAIKKSE